MSYVIRVSTPVWWPVGFKVYYDYDEAVFIEKSNFPGVDTVRVSAEDVYRWANTRYGQYLLEWLEGQHEEKPLPVRPTGKQQVLLLL